MYLIKEKSAVSIGFSITNPSPEAATFISLSAEMKVTDAKALAMASLFTAKPAAS